MKKYQKICTILFAIILPVVLHAQQKPSELIDIIDDVEEISYVEKLESNHFAEKYLMYVQQEVDWASKSAGKFNERIIVCFRGFDRPTVIVTEGYFAHYALFPSYEDELSRLFNTNIIVCEYRYFGESVPKECNWDYLTVDNSLADIHHVREIFGNIFPGKWISTGISKGGQTTMFYRATYPDDMDISVSYVAPLNKAVEDGRHEPFLSKQVGTKQEREAILNAQQELLSRKNTLIELFKDHTRKARLKFQLPTEDIYDYCVFEFPFALWQWGTSVNSIPPKSATDREWFDYFIKISDPDYFSCPSEYTPFFVQAARELGYYGYSMKKLKKGCSVKSTKNYLKKLVMQARLELKEAHDKGEDIAAIMSESRQQLQDLSKYKQSIKQIYAQNLKECATEQEINELQSAVNMMLEEKGCAPMNFTPLTKMRLMKGNSDE